MTGKMKIEINDSELVILEERIKIYCYGKKCNP